MGFARDHPKGMLGMTVNRSRKPSLVPPPTRPRRVESAAPDAVAEPAADNVVAIPPRESAVIERQMKYVQSKQRTDTDEINTRIAELVKRLEASERTLAQVHHDAQLVTSVVQATELRGVRADAPMRWLEEHASAARFDATLAHKGERVHLLFPMRDATADDGRKVVLMRFKRVDATTAALSTGWAVVGERDAEGGLTTHVGDFALA